MNSASKITIITDSASDMPGNLHNQVTVLPMTVSFGDEQFEDGVTLSADEFYMKLIESDTLPKTSQVSPFAFTSAYETALTHSDAVHYRNNNRFVIRNPVNACGNAFHRI